MRSRRLLVATSVLLLSWANGAGQAAAQTADAARLCIVPVPLSPADQHYSPHGPPTIMQARIFPGSRWPAFYTWGMSTRTFVLNEKDQLEAPHGFAIDLLGNYLSEPSGRLIAFWPVRGRPQVYIQDPANGSFIGLPGTDNEAIGFVSRAAWVASRHATLIGTTAGIYSLAGDPMPTIRRLALTGPAIGKVFWIDDLPLHRAVGLATESGSAFILNSDNSVREVPGFRASRPYAATRFREIDDPDRLLIEANEDLWTAPLRREGDVTTPGQAQQLASYVFEGNVLQYYPAIHRYLVYARFNSWFSASPSLLQLDDKLTPVEGSSGFGFTAIRNVASRGIVTIETLKGGIFTYDGKGAVKPVPHSSAAEIGAYPKVYELTGQDNKVVVLTISGLYELTAASELHRLPLPAELEGAKFDRLAELPASHAAVVFSNRGAFELDPDGRLSRVEGAPGVDFGIAGVDAVARIPVRETLFASTFHSGSFMVLDRDRDGEGACAPAR